MSLPESDVVRPTQRCLKDLGCDVPTLDIPLHEVSHEVIADTQRMPAQYACGGTERIVSLTDRVWLKHRSGRFRAAVARLSDGDLGETLREAGAEGRWWIGAAGTRRADSGDDFYASLKRECERHGSKKAPSTDHLLPQDWDERRLVAERAVAWRRELKRMVVEIIARSLRTGRMAIAEYERHRVKAFVRAESRDEAYLAIGAEGVADPRVLALVLDAVPGLSDADWQPEPGSVAGIEPDPGELIWSTMLPPEVASEILDLVPDE